MKLPEHTYFYKNTYPENKVYASLNRLPIFANMAKIVLKLLWKSASTEEYRSRALVDNGRAQSEFDFLYVLKGSLQIKLDKVVMDGADHRIQSTFVEFMQGEFVDSKTITDRRIKPLKNLNFREETNNIVDIQEQDNIHGKPGTIHDTITTNASNQRRIKNPFLDRTVDELRALAKPG